MAKRVLVTVTPALAADIARLRVSGIDNKRFWSHPSSESEVIRRLIIAGLESREPIEAAIRDAETYGDGFVKDGKHVDRDEVLAPTPKSESP